MEFFRQCPACGRRFHTKLESKKLVHLDRESVSSFRGPVLLGEGSRPIVVDVEKFQYSYKCQHCGHEWSEKRVEEHREA
jgi:DNA-directed RNA polymerase subunit RPC12/RpoP